MQRNAHDQFLRRGGVYCYRPSPVFRSPVSPRWLIAMAWRLSCCVRHALSVNIFFSRTTGPILTNLECSICRVRRWEIVNLVYPQSVKLRYFLKNLLYSWAWLKQIRSNNDQRRVYQILNFKNSLAGVLVLGCGHKSHTVKKYYFFSTLFSTQGYDRSMTKEGSTSIVNFITPRVGFFVLYVTI